MIGFTPISKDGMMVVDRMKAKKYRKKEQILKIT